MSTVIVIDTYAWIEYFSGSAQGERVATFISGNHTLIVPSIVVAELSGKYHQAGLQAQWETEAKPFIELVSVPIPLEHELANRAGQIRTEKRKEWKNFGLADGVVAATAEFVNGKILTGDKHLLGKNAIDIR